MGDLCKLLARAVCSRNSASWSYTSGGSSVSSTVLSLITIWLRIKSVLLVKFDKCVDVGPDRITSLIRLLYSNC